MADFEHIDKMLRQLKGTRLAQDFHRYRAVLIDLGRRYEKLKGHLREKIQDVVPKVRSNELPQSALTEIVTEYLQSVYEKENFLILLNTRKKEIETAEFIIYYEGLPNNKFIDLDHTGDMAECVIGHDYTVVYSLEILPKEFDALGDKHENGDLKEDSKWFMNEEKVGENRPLIKDFTELSKNNQEASICFLISLNRIEDGIGSFQLNLLKGGEIVFPDFEAPRKIWKMEIEERLMKSVKVKIYHDAISPKHGTLSARYQLRAVFKQKRQGATSIDSPDSLQSTFEEMEGYFDPTKFFSIVEIRELEAASIYEIDFTISVFEGTQTSHVGYQIMIQISLV